MLITKRLGALVAATVAAGVLAPAAMGAAQTPQRLRLTPFVAAADFPTNMAFAPDGRLFYDEKVTGRIRIVSREGEVLPEPFATLPVDGGGENGLLGLALDPHFDTQPFVYAYYSGDDGTNHLVRIRAEGDRGGEPETLLDLLQWSGIHNGGDITFGLTDGKLYIVTGETGDSSLAQDPGSLGGKVLRLNPDGSIPDDNPTPGSPVYTLGHRNSFGLCFNLNGDLWETENGPSEFDEVNRIEAGKNYGWPDQLGPGGIGEFQPPVLAFREIIVPTGCAFAGGALYFGDFHGDLHRVTLDPALQREARQATIVAQVDDGITDLQVGPDGMLYVATAGAILRTALPRTPPPSEAPGTGAPPTSEAPPPPRRNDSDGEPGPLGIVLAVVGAVAVLALVGSLVMRRRRRSSAMD